ncbi:MAG: FAD-dependent tricarballylate dehydrogenase TcuA [Pseudomonadota bacterium]
MQHIPPQQTDVLVIGGGNAALCAAISAREQGARVVMLERAPQAMRGGNTRHVRNFRVMHSTPLETLSDCYDAQEYWQDIQRVTGGKTQPELTRMMIEASPELLSWYKDLGVYFQPSLSGTLSLDRTNAFFLGGGCALANTLYRAAAELGVEIFYNCDVRALDIADGHFRSATYYAGDNPAPRQVQANSLVAACGGFQANRSWLEEIWGPAAQNFLIRGTPYNEGTVLRALLDHHISPVGDADQCHAVAIDARAPAYDGGIVSRLDCVCFSIVVNRHAQRFYDEGEDFWPKRYAIWGRLVAQQDEQIAYAIIDNKVINNFMPSVFPPITADSIDELAAKLDLSPSALNQTLARFNQAVVAGQYDPTQLDDCATHGLHPPKSHWARTIDQAPFHAYPLRPGITFTYLGVKVDASARMQMRNDQPSSNLFAAGEIMAGNILGQGYCAGTGMTIGGVFGRIAGREAACLNNL